MRALTIVILHVAVATITAAPTLSGLSNTGNYEGSKNNNEDNFLGVSNDFNNLLNTNVLSDQTSSLQGGAGELGNGDGSDSSPLANTGNINSRENNNAGNIVGLSNFANNLGDINVLTSKTAVVTPKGDTQSGTDNGTANNPISKGAGNDNPSTGAPGTGYPGNDVSNTPTNIPNTDGSNTQTNIPNTGGSNTPTNEPNTDGLGTCHKCCD